MRHLLLLPLLVACAPEFTDELSLVTSARVLAVKSEPAEARPGTRLRLSALVATPSAADDSLSVSWRLCDAPRPSTENNLVASACLDEAALGDALFGQTVTLAALRDACARFGPDTPKAGLRPRAPDATGGYFQPIRIELPGAVTTYHMSRLQCGLSEAAADLANAFGRSYVPNVNPSLESLTASVAGRTTSLDKIPGGAVVALELHWPADAQEDYVYFDRKAQALTTRRETLRVDWYVDGGHLESSAVLFAEDNSGRAASNLWTAPRQPGPFRLWIVLHDSRGGADFASYPMQVVPAL